MLRKVVLPVALSPISRIRFILFFEEDYILFVFAISLWKLYAFHYIMHLISKDIQEFFKIKI
jgi:hypothetical protein